MNKSQMTVICLQYRFLGKPRSVRISNTFSSVQDRVPLDELVLYAFVQRIAEMTGARQKLVLCRKARFVLHVLIVNINQFLNIQNGGAFHIGSFIVAEDSIASP
jgi:hypothetical protein